MSLKRIVSVGFGALLLSSASAWSQQTLPSPKQCENHRQELVLADIAHQEARSRCANIIRQAVELEAQVKRLEGEKKQLHDEVARLKEAADVAKTGDATPREGAER